MKLSITGLNHRSAPLEVRERLAFDPRSLGEALGDLIRRPGIAEGLILSTCNRVEVAVTSLDGEDPRPVVEEFLAARRGMEAASLAPYLYHFEGAEAIRHLFRVASSLDSMVVGEPQILGQLKAAYAAAKAHGAVGGWLEAVLTRAFSVAKRVRTETGIGENPVSISSTAVELAREIFGSLAGRRVMVVGAGKMAELAVRCLRSAGVSQIYVTNRTLERARAMAEAFEGTVVPYDRFLDTLPEMDIVLTSSAAPFYLLRKDHLRRVLEARRNKPVFLIDIAVPRNVDPAVNELENVFLYDIDDLQRVAEANLGERRKRAELAEHIVGEEVERMVARLRAREVTPTIVELQERLEQMRRAELARFRARLGPLSPEQRDAVEALTRSLLAKLAHGAITELRRQASQPEGFQAIEIIRRTFRLEE
ncbi:MAG: glutamyl-tRNA reductase [Bryobacterales bacterium]|nr:glutamyl-tRNA reductase [Bryobacteraceae bacterium]MDW8130881.1 glutamyl-tRNA reductase [Bryobacterales bacterium]